jgi:Ca2+-binding EF-hand superfamily protein
MKYITLGLLAASLAVSPAMASWKPAFFAKIDTDSNKVLTREELSCAKPKLFKYSDKDNNGVLSYGEFFKNRELLKLCK